MSPQSRFGEKRVFESLGLSKPLHRHIIDYARENPEKLGLDVALTASGAGNIYRGGRMTHRGILAIRKTQTMSPGLSKMFASYRGVRDIAKGSRISRRGTLMASVGSIELAFDPDIPFVPLF
jgi:hypothetical protein